MKEIIFYSYSKCSTCRKAAKWLDKNGFQYQLIDILNKPPLLNYLELALEQYPSDIKKVFNTRGKAFKSINFDIYSLSIEEIIKLLLSDGKLIKRPFLINGEKIILGFDEAEYLNHFL